MNGGHKFYEGYEKLKTVGQGAFGTATLYRRINDGKQVVMKEVYLMNMDNEEKKSALNEVEILATLDHPNIIRYFGSFQKEGLLVIVMEYADGGNLTQLINAKKNKGDIFTERSILNIGAQTSSALEYMHATKILHRDLKTANIFLNMNGNVKVGDFGISKMLNTKSQAQTVVGTPYYLSPEMCEGSDYNDKSDIWALGCILYELACLRKPFEAATLPVLVQKIVACHYEDIPEMYSDDLSKLIKSILQKIPNLRPSAKYINKTAIPKITSKNKEAASGRSYNQGVQKERSIMYKVNNFGDTQNVIPVELPHKKIFDFSISNTHQIVVFTDHSLYAWGANDHGQLGLQCTSPDRAYPTQIDFLKPHQIRCCAAGTNFSLFLARNGTLFSCGNGQSGCLGHGDLKSFSTPQKIETLNNVIQLSCGDDHVMVLTSEQKLFTWGSSKFGQLGQGHVQSRCAPLAIKAINLPKIKNIFCGSHESVLVAFSGQVFVSGLNNCGKLGIPNKDIITTFTAVLSLKDKIKSVSVGNNHSAMLTENGAVIIFGRTSRKIVTFKTKIMRVGCGLNFIIAADNENVVWFWESSNHKKESGCTEKSRNSVTPLGKFVPDNKVESTGQHLKEPKSILAFYASKTNLKEGNIIYLGNMSVHGSSLYLVAHTTSAPPIQQYTHTDLNNPPDQTFVENTTKEVPAFMMLPNTM